MLPDWQGPGGFLQQREIVSLVGKRLHSPGDISSSPSGLYKTVTFTILYASIC